MERLRRRPVQISTLHDVAQLAGVSPMTASRVVNRESTVGPEKRELVLAAIRKLNYSPSRAARSLAGAETHRIAVAYSNPSSGYMSEFLLGVLQESSRAATQLIVEQFSESDSVAEVLERLHLGSSNGVVLPPPLCEWQELLDGLSRTGIPVVAVATGHALSSTPSIRIDNELAARELTQHLLDHGHRHFGFISGHPNQSVSAQRFAGFLGALQGAGISRASVQVEQGYFTYRSGLESAARLLAVKSRPTAIFAANDDMAAATSTVAHRMGLDVPKDISIVGFDDTAIATSVWPALTTIHQPIAEMARTAVDCLLQQLRRKRRAWTIPPQKIAQHRLCVRESSGPCLTGVNGSAVPPNY
jgi:LacI family transcriptional regulator